MAKRTITTGRGGRAATLCIGGLAVTLILAACANERPESLDATRTELSQARDNPQMEQYAADELNASARALERAERAWQDGQPDAEIDHLVYLSRRHIDIAEAAAEEERAEETIDELQEKRERLRLEARERDIELAEERAREARDALQRLQEELEAERTERGLVLTLGNILFGVDQAQLKPGGRQQLRRLAAFLEDNPGRKLLIEGHTDSQASDTYNLKLSQRRADAVEDYLTGQGISPGRMAARGYGEQFPLTSNDTAAGRQENRRVEIVILDKGEALPAPRGEML